jgi:predicted  nucleic acid-binding Zn-ribbon protein
MIEPIMYFGIGFLVAALIGLVVIPLVHGRAVRLTMRRLEAATPLSMAEIQADKDQLRAEFAMSTRRLEKSVEQLKGKTTSQLAEIGKKGDAINRLKIELGEKTATIFALEARDKALRDQLRATEDEVAAKTSARHDAERALTDKESELAKLLDELDERSSLADAQRIEIVALKTQVEALKDRLTDAGNEVKAVEDRRDAERVELKAVTQELADERGRVENLGRRVAELEQMVAAQTKEAELLGRRAQDLENRLGEQSRTLNQSEFELKQAQNELGVARKIESDLRASIAELESRFGATTKQLSTENAQLSSDLSHAVSERDRLTREIAAMKRETEETWASERVENSLLRERINDVAVEVARLASALEGPNSSIDAILAAEVKRDHAGVGAGAAHGAKFAGTPSTNGDLADRIRALQNHASRVPHGNKPTSRN